MRRTTLAFLAASLCSLALLADPASATPPAQPTADAALAPGREVAGMFFRRELAGLWDRFSDDFKREMSSDSLRALRLQIDNQLGAEQRVLDESVRREGEYDVYRRLARYAKYDGSIEMLVLLRTDGKIAGFVIRDPRSVQKR